MQVCEELTKVQKQQEDSDPSGGMWPSEFGSQVLKAITDTLSVSTSELGDQQMGPPLGHVAVLPRWMGACLPGNL